MELVKEIKASSDGVWMPINEKGYFDLIQKNPFDNLELKEE